MSLETARGEGAPAVASGKPELFFSPSVVRANRCFIKGYLPRERMVRELARDRWPFSTT